MKKFFISLFLFFVSLNAFGLSEQQRILKQAVLYENNGEYLQNSLYGGLYVLRWNKAYFPVKVYIQKGFDVPNYYFESFEHAVEIWQKELKGLISFTQAKNKNDADIIFQIIKRQTRPKDLAVYEEEPITLAYTESVIKNKKLKKMIISVYEKDEFGNFYKPNLILNTAVHEFAHALGVLGHSNDSQSIMYAASNSVDIEKRQIYITNQDRNTIKLLYKIQPDITNGNKNKETDNISAEVILGTLNERIDLSIENLLKETELYRDFSTMLNLAVLYRQKKDYKTMYKFLDIAQTYAVSKEDSKNLYITYAAYYSDLHNPICSIWYILKFFFS